MTEADYLFEERAAIAEFENGCTRVEAERIARETMNNKHTNTTP